LNPERLSMPDFDIDFCQDGRDKVIEYVKQKYGAESVSQIATFGTLQARAVVRDVGRVLDLPYSFCDSIAKLIPFQPGRMVTLKRRPPGPRERTGNLGEARAHVVVVKCRFLSLYTVTILDGTVRYIHRLDPASTITVENIPLDDKDAYDIFKSGNTVGVFQFESRGMRELLLQAPAKHFD